MEILITATPQDLRFARICLASIRYFYPELCVRILPGAILPRSFLSEVAKHWDVGTFPVERGDYGWAFVHLEPLFQEGRKRFLVLDADTILLGPVTERFGNSKADFLVDDEVHSEADIKGLYYDWETVRGMDRNALRPKLVFNSGQWFGTSGILSREDFTPWVEWGLPRRLKHPKVFMPGEQGVLNYVINQKAQRDGLAVEAQKIMRWPGHGLDDITLERLKESPFPQIIHWAGYKAPWLETLPRADLLLHFEKLYYEKVEGGERLRTARARNQALAHRFRTGRTKVLQGIRQLFGR